MKGRLRKLFEAISDFDTAIRLDPNEAAAYGNRGIAKALLGHDNEAISDYDTSIHLDPDNANFYNNRGVSKNALGHTNAAKVDFQSALNLAEKTKNESLKAQIMKQLTQVQK